MIVSIQSPTFWYHLGISDLSRNDGNPAERYFWSVYRYLDGILTTGMNQKDHAAHLKEIRKRLDQAGLRLIDSR